MSSVLITLIFSSMLLDLFEFAPQLALVIKKFKFNNIITLQGTKLLSTNIAKFQSISKLSISKPKIAIKFSLVNLEHLEVSFRILPKLMSFFK